MTNPVIDLERAEYLRARSRIGKRTVPAWPRQDKELTLAELEVDWVRFSTLNHRTKAEQRAEIARTKKNDLFRSDPLGISTQAAQYEILRKQQGFGELKSDLKVRGQQEPAIVTADGILINGNRRTAAMRSLYLDDNHLACRYVKCLVLPDDATSEELVDLETELQIARDFKQDYGWINEAFLIEELFDRENRDFNRVAQRMHRDLSDVRSRYEKLQQVHQLVALSAGIRQHIDFNENESAFDELTRHIKSKGPAEAESVRAAYFLGTLANVQYRKLRPLQRADASHIVKRELDNDPTLRKLLAEGSSSLASSDKNDPLDDVLGNSSTASPLMPLLHRLAQAPTDGELQVGDDVIPVADILTSVNSAVTAAADEAEEDLRDQTAVSAPILRADKAIAEIERAIGALPRARALEGFDREGMAERISSLRILVGQLASESE